LPSDEKTLRRRLYEGVCVETIMAEATAKVN
jgi:hypothetical protein